MNFPSLGARKKIVIAGGSGYLGRFVARHFLAQGYEVVTLARTPFSTGGPRERVAFWDGVNVDEKELAHAEILLNLAGRSVNCRYSKKNRAEILGSRVESTCALGRAIERLAPAERPKVWLNFSTATIYRHSLDQEMSEESALGKGFSVEIAKHWENSFFSYSFPETRQVALRSAMVFGPGEEGVYGAYRGIVRKGLGGAAAGGKQFVSWIHWQDFLLALDWLRDHPVRGVVNLASPDPRPNREFMKALRESLHARFALPAPEWMLELGAIFFRTETELLLKSRRVVPGRLLSEGFRFRFPRLEAALLDLSEAEA